MVRSLRIGSLTKRGVRFRVLVALNFLNICISTSTQGPVRTLQQCTFPRDSYFLRADSVFVRLSRAIGFTALYGYWNGNFHQCNFRDGYFLRYLFLYGVTFRSQGVDYGYSYLTLYSEVSIGLCTASRGAILVGCVRRDVFVLPTLVLRGRVRVETYFLRASSSTSKRRRVRGLGVCLVLIGLKLRVYPGDLLCL